MDSKLIGEQITRYRKEKNLTQEELGRAAGVSTQAVSRWENGGAPDVALLPAIADKLGVTIDALFGREGGEGTDIHKTMLRWMKGLPADRRLDQLCRLVWTLLNRGGLSAVEMPKIDYPAHAEFSGGEGDGRLMLCQYRLKDGIALDVHSDEFTFVTLWPEPEAGYDAFLAPRSEYRKFFQLLSRPGCLELLEYMYRTEAHYFVPEVAAKQTGLPVELVEELLEEMDGRQMVWSMALDLPGGTVKAYQTAGLTQLVPVLYTSRCLMQRGMNMTYQTETDAPVFKGGLWREEKESGHEKK